MASKSADKFEFQTQDEYDALAQLRKLSLPAIPCVKDTQLSIITYGSTTGVTQVTARIWFMTRSGDIQTYFKPCTVNSDRSSATTNLILGDGYLIGLTLQPVGGPPRRGQLYCLAILRDGKDPSNILTLCQGYCDATHFVSSFTKTDENSIDGRGNLRTFVGTNPAPGSEVSEAVPTNARWKLRGMVVTLATSATVATRTVNVIIDDGGSIFYQVASATTQAASEGDDYQFNQYNAVPTDTATLHYMPLPQDVILFQSWRIRTSTTNLQAGDDWGAPLMMVEEWIED